MSKFAQIIKTAPHTWTRDDLRSLSNAQLDHLARLLGIPTSGTKAKKIERITTAAAARTAIKDWAIETRGDLVSQYTQAQLKTIAKQAGTMHYGSKIVMITALLNWREECRTRGQAYNDQYRAAMKEQPRQAQLEGFSAAEGQYTTVFVSWTARTTERTREAQPDAEQLSLF